MSLHEEFEAYRQHYHHMQELLAGAQRSVNDGPWDWIGGDRVPGIGGDGLEPLPGADTLNSYDLRTDRIWSPPEPPVTLGTCSRWSTTSTNRAGAPRGPPRRDHDTWAKTDDGWQIEYVVQPNGDYSLTVFSELFWTNDDDALIRSGRRPQRRRLPGRVPAGRVPAVPGLGRPDHQPPEDLMRRSNRLSPSARPSWCRCCSPGARPRRIHAHRRRRPDPGRRRDDVPARGVRRLPPALPPHAGAAGGRTTRGQRRPVGLDRQRSWHRGRWRRRRPARGLGRREQLLPPHRPDLGAPGSDRGPSGSAADGRLLRRTGLAPP